LGGFIARNTTRLKQGAPAKKKCYPREPEKPQAQTLKRSAVREGDLPQSLGVASAEDAGWPLH